MESVQVTILGSGDAFSSGGRGFTCFHVQAGRFRMLIDCGATALTALKQRGIPAAAIDTIVLTHFHGDHFAGLPFLILDMARTGRNQPLTIISPPGGKAKLAQAMALFYPGSAHRLKSLSIHYLAFKAGIPLRAGPLAVTAYPVIHTKETLPHGVRAELGGKTIAYSGDTEWTDNLIPLAREADLFICECCFFEKVQKGHLNYRQLQQHLPELTSRRILLTHPDEELLAHRAELDLELAEDGMVVEVS